MPFLSIVGKPTYAPIAPAPVRDSSLESNLKPPQPTSASTEGLPTARNTDGKLTGQKRPPPSPGTPKKRPYRRTRRPAGYNDRSTVTTVTKKEPGSAASVDAYDAVIAECEDLLNASLEAQQLGRLKMAAAYQLLLHTRLVGLGKQFDRNAMKHASTILPASISKAGTQSYVGARLAAESEGGESDKKPAASLLPSAAHRNHNDDNDKPASQNNQSSVQSNNSDNHLLKQLSSILPQDAIMDSTMMEHLARAAAELHHQRTGRKKSLEGLLASPPSSLENMTKPKPLIPDRKTPKPRSPAKSPNEIGSKSSRWSNAEMDIVEKGIEKKWEPATMAKILSNKNEEQIREYLKQRSEGKLQQQQQKQQASRAHALSAARNSSVPTRSVPNAAGGGAAASQSTKAAAAKITQSVSAAASAAGDSSSHHNNASQQQQAYFDSAGTENPFGGGNSGGGDGDTIASSPNSKLRRGGRGRKPPTTAMNTVSTVLLDVRSLLKGNIGQKEKE